MGNRMPWLLIALAICARLLPHPFNLTPVGALGLFAGAYVPPRLALLVPLVALLVGDALTGFYDPVVMAGVYLGMLAGPCVGHWLLRTRRSVARIGGAVTASAVFFFLTSNFAMWFSGPYYPPTLDGLLACYLNGLPYLGYSLLGDGACATLLFGGFELARRGFAAHQNNGAHA